MTKTEMDVITRLLGFRRGSIQVRAAGKLRDVHPGRVYDVCRKLEAEGIGRIDKLDHIAFTFTTHDALLAQEEAAAA